MKHVDVSLKVERRKTVSKSDLSAPPSGGGFCRVPIGDQVHNLSTFTNSSY